MSTTEIKLQNAISAFKNGKLPSQRAAASELDVPLSTLNNRVTEKSSPRRAAAEAQQRLSKEQEDYLVRWIIQLDRSKEAPSHFRVREMAAKILEIGGDVKPLGKRWVNKFLTRHTQVKGMIGKPLDRSRVEASTQDAIGQFYTLFENIQQEFQVTQENVWNMDEHGLAQGVCANQRVLGESNKNSTYKKSSQDRQWVSIIETVSATSRVTRPLVIFKGTSIQSSWFEENVPDWIYTTSINGWTSNRLALGWLKSIFIPETNPLNESSWRILLLDGHGSHTYVDFQWECFQNKIHLLYMPPHTSHILQPLDLSCFSPLKARYRQLLGELSVLDDSAPIKKRKFIKCYHEARQERLTKVQIQGGWRAAGLFPFNRHKGLRNPFALPPVQERPKTPENQTKKRPFNERDTPRKPSDVYDCIQSLRAQSELTRRSTTAMYKAAKSIGGLQAELAEQRLLNQAQALEIERLSVSRKKKKVVVDSNTQFGNIQAIKRAQDQAREAEAREKENQNRAIREAQEGHNQNRVYSFEDCINNFEI